MTSTVTIVPILGTAIIDDDENYDRDVTVNGEYFDDDNSDFSDDPELVEYNERTEIVERYDNGVEGQEVDPWENPDFELYKVTDRHGFMHKSAPPSPSELEKHKRIAKELSRERKWLKMLDAMSPNSNKPVPKLRERVWKGIPDKLRATVWTKLMRVAELRHNFPIYKELLSRARIVSKDIKQIDLDINRTYRDHICFRKRYDIKQQSLFNVLAAYAMYNTEVGYCQGMSQITALLLMYLNEEDAFWTLHSLMVSPRHSMHGFFVPGFPKLIRFQNHYDRVLAVYLPRLNKYLNKVQAPPIYLTKWWFGCFLDRVPFSLALRIWDVYFLEGESILIAMAYNVMKLHQRTLRRLSMEQLMEYIQSDLAHDFRIDDGVAMKSLRECLRELTSDRMTIPPAEERQDLAELPTKVLGPVLNRSLLDIRMDIAELQSRASTANSTLGRVRRNKFVPTSINYVQEDPLAIIMTSPTREHSFYDNVLPDPSPQSCSESTEVSITHSVSHGPNNVTYVTVEDNNRNRRQISTHSHRQTLV